MKTRTTGGTLVSAEPVPITTPLWDAERFMSRFMHLDTRGLRAERVLTRPGSRPDTYFDRIETLADGLEAAGFECLADVPEERRLWFVI